MIHEKICTYEVCKLAKEKGFPQHIGDDAYIVENEYDDEYEVGCHYPIQFIPDYLPTITAPTQSLLQRWLREKKIIDIEITVAIAFDTFNGFHRQYDCQIKSPRKGEPIFVGGALFTYELALEDALKYALENLV